MSNPPLLSTTDTVVFLFLYFYFHFISKGNKTKESLNIWTQFVIWNPNQGEGTLRIEWEVFAGLWSLSEIFK